MRDFESKHPLVPTLSAQERLAKCINYFGNVLICSGVLSLVAIVGVEYVPVPRSRRPAPVAISELECAGTKTITTNHTTWQDLGAMAGKVDPYVNRDGARVYVGGFYVDQVYDYIDVLNGGLPANLPDGIQIKVPILDTCSDVLTPQN